MLPLKQYLGSSKHFKNLKINVDYLSLINLHNDQDNFGQKLEVMFLMLIIVTARYVLQRFVRDHSTGIFDKLHEL